MTTITIQREARCKDCKHCESIFRGKRNLHRCINLSSKQFMKQITLKDRVCDNWEF